MAADLALKLRLLASDEGVVGKPARVSASAAGLRREFDVLGDKSKASLSSMCASIESISRQLTLARNAWLALQGAMGVCGGLSVIANLADKVRLVDARLKLAAGSVCQAGGSELAACRT